MSGKEWEAAGPNNLAVPRVESLTVGMPVYIGVEENVHGVIEGGLATVAHWDEYNGHMYVFTIAAENQTYARHRLETLRVEVPRRHR